MDFFFTIFSSAAVSTEGQDTPVNYDDGNGTGCVIA